MIKKYLYILLYDGSTLNIKSQQKSTQNKNKEQARNHYHQHRGEEKAKQRYQNKKRDFKICQSRISFDEKIDYVKKYKTCSKKAKQILLLCKVLLIFYFMQ